MRWVTKLVNSQPSPRALFPYAVGEPPRSVFSSEPTACLTSGDQVDMQLLVPWLKNWPGPISLLVRTTTIPLSIAHRRLVHRIEEFRKSNSRSNFQVHLLHVWAHTEQSNNAYLNLARLFAPTRNIVLFPGNVSVVASTDLYREAASWSNQATTPFLLPDPDHPEYSPLAIPFDHGLWCTERFFPYNTRQSDWQECIWQFWLENYGNISTGNMKAVIQELPRPSLSKIEVRGMATFNRLRVEFRAESCELVARQLETTLGHKSLSLNRLRHICS
ncbi:hypothetical protein BDN72DRAFT_760659 [Pluteus cervinus]|uniref:Uncharacterized protein n=1 Tax=Pluteus cervinus TaxID=181527 RepID=A0ACD3B818_9AGAR|nr:hypothetical protein BDN72DRAFT_760659 [Pluteus cervinus]